METIDLFKNGKHEYSNELSADPHSLTITVLNTETYHVSSHIILNGSQQDFDGNRKNYFDFKDVDFEIDSNIKLTTKEISEIYQYMAERISTYFEVEVDESLPIDFDFSKLMCVKYSLNELVKILFDKEDEIKKHKKNYMSLELYGHVEYLKWRVEAKRLKNELKETKLTVKKQL